MSARSIQMYASLPNAARNAKSVDIAAYLSLHRTELVTMLDGNGSSGELLARRHAKIMDGLLMTLFPVVLASLKAEERPHPVLLSAVGGYGRGVLGWKSDLDVRLVTNEAPELIVPLAEALLYPLWDTGVSIGHQVARVSDVIEGARQDLPTATSLLDTRRIAGDAALANELEERAFAGLFSESELPAFIERLEAEVSQRHRRFGDSVYLLEPDVKSGAGGLRDLDIALWAARARYRVTSIHDLLRVGVLGAREAAELEEASNFLWTIRNHLHCDASRRSDRLTFEEQEVIAKHLRYDERIGRQPSATEDEIQGAMVEAFMSDYYRHARVIMRAREQIVARATPHPGRKRPHIEEIGHGVQVFDGKLTFSDLSQLDREPALILRLYAQAVARGLPVLPFARDVVIRKASEPVFCARLRESSEAATLFVSLVSAAQETVFHNGSVLSALHEVGLLTAMVPEFFPVVGRVHHDVYHVYTVDVHSVAAVDRLRALMRGDLVHEYPLASRLAAEVLRPEILCLATLLHDVGKAIGGRDHSRRGAVMAKDILARLGFSPEDIEEGCHLILQHLVMYLVAARRDLEDPTTIGEFAKEVRGREGLRDLYLLTVADLSTTGPTSMTKWKSRMLDDLFLATDDMLSGSSGLDAQRLSGVRKQVKERWAVPEADGFLDQFLDSMPERYLLSHAADEIVAHARVALEGRESVVSADFVPSRHPEVAELCVVTGDVASAPGLCIVTGDRPGLLASITAAIASNGLEVHAAQIHTRQLADGGTQAVDLFWITDRTDEPGDISLVLPRLRRDLQRVITGSVPARDLIRKRSVCRWSERPLPAVSTEIVVDNRSSARHTLVEVVTRDRPGLLYMLSQALHQLDLTIVVAKINTEGTRVVDVFYVTELDGKRLETAGRIQAVREGLFAALKPSVAA